MCTKCNITDVPPSYGFDFRTDGRFLGPVRLASKLRVALNASRKKRLAIAYAGKCWISQTFVVQRSVHVI